MQFVVSGTKWCHLTWTTFRGRQLFKIAATSQFCERAIHDKGARSGVPLDTIAVLPDRIHVLLEMPVFRTRDDILEAVKATATAALRDNSIISRWHRRVWEPGGWCAVLSNTNAVWAVRKHVSTLSQLRYPGVVPGGRTLLTRQ